MSLRFLSFPGIDLGRDVGRSGRIGDVWSLSCPAVGCRLGLLSAPTRYVVRPETMTQLGDPPDRCFRMASPGRHRRPALTDR